MTSHRQAPKSKLHGLMCECTITTEGLVGTIHLFPSDLKCPIIRTHMFDLPSPLKSHPATSEYQRNPPDPNFALLTTRNTAYLLYLTLFDKFRPNFKMSFFGQGRKKHKQPDPPQSRPTNRPSDAIAGCNISNNGNTETTDSNNIVNDSSTYDGAVHNELNISGQVRFGALIFCFAIGQHL